MFELIVSVDDFETAGIYYVYTCDPKFLLKWYSLKQMRQ